MDQPLWIENVSRIAIEKGDHSNLGENCMLIQIADPATFFPRPLNSFKEVHQFEFLDVEDNDKLVEFGITENDAAQLVKLLQHAIENNLNVIVHCNAGICRSGAVVEVGSMLGLIPTNRQRRQPNVRVKRMMMDALGWGYGK